MTVEASGGAGAIQSESEMTVSVIADMRVQYVTPASGPTEGGNVVMVYGKYCGDRAGGVQAGEHRAAGRA